jgi:hypothetical protein
MSRRVYVAAAFAALALAACDGANAFTGTQFGREGGGSGAGAIAGQVTADGRAQGGVPVVLVGVDSTATDGTGAFRFDSVAAGSYTVAVRVPVGFTLAAGQTATRTAVVTAGGTTGIAFVLTRTTTATP